MQRQMGAVSLRTAISDLGRDPNQEFTRLTDEMDAATDISTMEPLV
jgi:hypothetical protein